MSPDAFIRFLRKVTDEGATTTLEFIIAFPLIGTTMAVLLQLALLLHARTVVDYAAFCAARSASVWSPTEPVFDPEPSDDKARSEAAARIHRSAALACVPISPSISSFGAEGMLLTAVSDVPAELRIPGVPWFGTSLPGLSDRLTYAERAVRVSLQLRAMNEGIEAVELVEATVRFKQYLFVPVAAQLLGGDDPPEGLRGGEYAEISSTYTVELEAEITSGAVCQ